MTEEEKRLHRCCFTGHRPEKISTPETEIIAQLEAEVLLAIDNGITTFITGMARGVDIWAAEIVLKLRKNQPLHLICAPPFDGFQAKWDRQWQKRYTHILKKADLVKYICSGYSASCFQIRNEWMVDHSSRVIAVYNGQPSGTRNTIRYAERVGVPVRIISV